MKKIFVLCLLMYVNVIYATDVELAWYDGDTTINGPTSCTVGGTFLPPTPPTRTGYDFAGWKKIVRKCGIDDLNVDVNGFATGYASLNGDDGENESNYGLTSSGQWAAEFSYGTVWGMANCNSSTTTNYRIGKPTLASSGKQCWCQVTGFTVSGNDYTFGPQCTTTKSSKWLYINLNSTSSYCARMCASKCSAYVKNQKSGSETTRTRMFGAVGQ